MLTASEVEKVLDRQEGEDHSSEAKQTNQEVHALRNEMREALEAQVQGGGEGLDCCCCDSFRECCDFHSPVSPLVYLYSIARSDDPADGDCVQHKR